MSITFTPINPYDPEQAEEFASWYQDPVMMKNWVRQLEKTEEDPKPIYFTKEDFQKTYTPKKQGTIRGFMVKKNGIYFGYGQILIDPPMRMHKDPNARVGWPSMGIGREEFRGKGLGVAIGKEVLKLARSLECTHLEAGVFEFNDTIRDLLKKNGFQEIGRIPHITYDSGRWWDAVHYLKELT